MKDIISLEDWEGKLNLQVFRNDVCIQEENHNLIVDNASVVFAKLLALGHTTANARISRIAFGTGNVASNVIKTALDGDVFIKPITSYAFDEITNEAVFSFRLELHEFNNKSIWQFGLLNGFDELFSMFSRNPTYITPIEKDNEVYIIGTWKIKVV